ncbi:hypothetical protein PpBr36_00056 [Pyricularia pennisetigena]|uniref:hypothetical protein n=1 Tax=Pyricularia pennisetigena TaxID=1578925 RepID=UPI00114F4F3A|nr:hypothetical protein PpBr36_00056 [Pyricularia pennisetigena]TLS28144.1 hypothetical protein PpBr36_00056 [Pyricularia pennisetigena]
MSTNSTNPTTAGPPTDAVSQPHETRQPALYACVITTYTVSGILVSLRFYTRAVLLRRPLMAADWCILAAWLSTGGVVASSLEQLHYGLGLHVWDTDPAVFPLGVRAAWYGYVFYSTAMCLTKVSILLLYLTFLGVGRRARRAALATLASVVVANLWIAASNFTACVPLQAYWDYALRARLQAEEGRRVYCHPNMVWYVNSSINVVTDFVIFALPLPVVLGMRKLAWRQKMTLMGLFGMGFFVCIVAIIRLVFLTSADRSQDSTWNISVNTFWTDVEVNMSIAVASAMTLRPLMTRWFPRAFVSFDGGDADKHDSARENANTSLDAANFVNDVAVAPPTIGSRRTRTPHRDEHARAESWIDFPGKLDGRNLNDLEQGRIKLKDVSTTTTAISSPVSFGPDEAPEEPATQSHARQLSRDKDASWPLP